MRETKVWLGVMLMVVSSVVFANNSNATPKNNLLSKPASVKPTAQKAVFLVSEAKTKVVLEKYRHASALTDYDLVKMLKAVGFDGKGLKTAWAVAKAESNGRPFAFNGNARTGDSSYGVFQINMIGNLGPDRRNRFNLDTNAELFSPVKNAEIAFHMTKGGKDWSAWKHAKPIQYQRWLKKFPDKYV